VSGGQRQRIVGLAANGPGALVITHEPHELGVFDEVLRLSHGRIEPAAKG